MPLWLQENLRHFALFGGVFVIGLSLGCFAIWHSGFKRWSFFFFAMCQLAGLALLLWGWHPVGGYALATTIIGMGAGVAVALAIIVYYSSDNRLVAKTDGFLGLIRFLLRSADRRSLYLLAALFGAVVLTLMFRENYTLTDGSGDQYLAKFWAGYYPSWLASLIFFTVVGVLTTVMTYSKPEHGAFADRVRILVSGNVGAVRDYVQQQLLNMDTIRYYHTDYNTMIKITEFNESARAVKLEFTTESIARSTFADQPSTFRASITYVPDSPFEDEPDPLGSVISMKVNGESLLAGDPIEMRRSDMVDSPEGPLWTRPIPNTRITFEPQTVETVWTAWFRMDAEQVWSGSRFIESGTVGFQNGLQRRGFRVSVEHQSEGGAPDETILRPGVAEKELVTFTAKAPGNPLVTYRVKIERVVAGQGS